MTIAVIAARQVHIVERDASLVLVAATKSVVGKR